MERRRFDRWTLGAEALARALLGQVLVRVERGHRCAGRIVETEAYLGGEDLGSHSAGDRRTARNESMFLPGGHAYVYFVYGLHHCFNVVAAPEGKGCAVLIRAIEPMEGTQRMTVRRGLDARAKPPLVRAIASGPARLCEAMAIDRRFDGENLAHSHRLFIEVAPSIPSRMVLRGARIGIPYAGDWAGIPLRFLVADHPCVSRPIPK